MMDTTNQANPAEADTRDEVVVKCPATGEIVGTVPVTTVDGVAAAAARLRAAQPEWQRLGVSGRACWLGRWRDWMLDHRDDLLTPLQLETGKSWGDAGIEIATVQVINYWIDNAAEFLADQPVRPYGAANAAKKLTIVYEPYPLVGVITPWNGPLSVPLLDVPAALLAGCAVLSKPSEFTPLAWQHAVEGWKQIGAPDVLDVVFGFGETGAALVDVVDYVMFTGSVGTGHRAPDRRRRGRTVDPVRAGTWRQRRDDRLRGRRHRQGGRRRGLGRIRLHRPSLHFGGTDLCRGPGI